MELNWLDHLIFIIIGLIIPLNAVFKSQPELAGMRFSSKMKIALYWGNNAYLWGLSGAILFVWWFNDRSWETLGLTAEFVLPQGWPLIAIIAFLILYLLDTFGEIYSNKKRQQTTEEMSGSLGFLPNKAKEYLHFISLALTAGICEEIIFRGYFIRYFQLLLGADSTATLAILFSALIFGFVHFYQGWHAVIKITGMAVMFGFVFVHTQSLWLLIIIHALIDLIGGAIAWALLREKG